MGMKVTRATTTAALAAFSLLATPCLAATEPAPPSMVVTRINGRSVDPLIAFAEAGGTQSMFVDAVIVTALNIHGTTVSPPPPKYDKAYANVEVVFDLPWVEGGGWGFTEPPARPGGRCVIHVAPLGSALQEEDGVEVLEAVGLPRLLRHEYGHCRHLIHGDLIRGPAASDKWNEVAPADREKLAALVHRQWLEIIGQRDVTPARPATTADGKPRRVIAPSGPRAFSGEGY